eukprot:scaffold79524_cov24-Tisochrysis_lutea.AAC.1
MALSCCPLVCKLKVVACSHKRSTNRGGCGVAKALEEDLRSTLIAEVAILTKKRFKIRGLSAH